MNLKKTSLLLISFIVMAFGLPKNIQKKVDKEIRTIFKVDTFSLNSQNIPKEIAQKLPSRFNDYNLFKITSDSVFLGYAYVSKAPSKTDKFDYLVLLNKDLVVLKAKVLVYREDYGGEIGSKRWLKQFIGKTKNDTLLYGDNIVAISGATISVRSMTNAVNNLLESLRVLNSKKIL